MKYLLTSLLPAIMLIACKSDIKSGPNAELYTEVMAIHDEVMPKMTDIHQIKKEIKKQYNDSTSENYAASVEMLGALTAADEGMMSWMADFKIPEQASPEDQKEYLQQQKIAITQVRNDMLSAIEEAKAMTQ